VLRRGDLTIAVSTGGGSPGLAARICRFLGGLFGPEWGGRLDQVAGLRRRWRKTGAPPSDIARQTEAWVDRQGWLPPAMPLRRPPAASSQHR
jgi:precorrin-2 dehydrogenase/sirohydrochlorin ferrochelatase